MSVRSCVLDLGSAPSPDVCSSCMIYLQKHSGLQNFLIYNILPEGTWIAMNENFSLCVYATTA